MDQFGTQGLKQLYIPPAGSHKGQNGKVLVVGGSKLFHAASLWALSIASRIVDMVFYASVPENNEIVSQAKNEFRNGIVVPREDLEHYVKESDVILIGPGLMRSEQKVSSIKYQVSSIAEINNLEDEGEQTYLLTKLLLEKFPEKKFVLDAGSLQMMEPEWLIGLKQMPILTPHKGEFEMLFSKIKSEASSKKKERLMQYAKDYHCVILLKGPEDLVCSPSDCVSVAGGNAGMTKGGTGDVLAGLTAGLYAQNADAFLVAQAASFFNKKAGESLFKRAGYYFNASDLVVEIPVIMKQYLIP